MTDTASCAQNVEIHLDEIADDYGRAAEGLDRRIIICTGTGCVANGSMDVRDRFIQEIGDAGLHVVELVAGVEGVGGVEYRHVAARAVVFAGQDAVQNLRVFLGRAAAEGRDAGPIDAVLFGSHLAAAGDRILFGGVVLEERRGGGDAHLVHAVIRVERDHVVGVQLREDADHRLGRLGVEGTDELARDPGGVAEGAEDVEKGAHA